MADPFPRLAREPDAAWNALVRYRDQGARSLSALAAELGVRVEVVKRMSARWDWVARCRAWDSHLQAGRDAATAAAARRWAERRQSAREQAWLSAQALRAKAAKMLGVDLDAASWGMRDAAAFLKLAAELEAAAMGQAADGEAGEAGGGDGLAPDVAAAMRGAGLAAAGLDRDAEDANGPY